MGDEEAHRESDVGTGLVVLTFLYLGLSLTTVHGFQGDIATGGGADGEGGASPLPCPLPPMVILPRKPCYV
ncbi:hypothetical protein SZ63_02815 [Methanoculleus sediminis]|uniref:Uncharacterized protein n=1 Tax=Methanoculleus sediminis TaxID=1550566 RepID=A0A0H1QZF7_9EURY|nr:hypothetical protein SZ63_02815 [Methanoculleus sediminis]